MGIDDFVSYLNQNKQEYSQLHEHAELYCVQVGFILFTYQVGVHRYPQLTIHYEN